MATIYLAGPFFSDEQIDRIANVEKALSKNKTVSEFYSPRQNQEAEHKQFTLPWANEIYHRDMNFLQGADAVLAVVDFTHGNVDSGTAFEIGAAVEMGTPVVVYQQKNDNLNLMISESLTAYLKTTKQIADYDFTLMPESHYTGEIF